MRKYEKGVVVAAPAGADVDLDEEYIDVTTGETSRNFTISEGDGRFFLLKSLTG